VTDDQTAYDELNPKERAERERLIPENLRMIGEHVAAGWTWSKNTMTHHEDPDIHYWIEPYTQQIVLSPKLAEAIASGRLPQLKTDRAEGLDGGH
jgi:hypothetical protein